jgi:hypothetical protein
MDVIKDFQHPIHVEQHKDCSLMVYTKKDRQHNGKDKQRSAKHAHKTTDRATQTPHKTGGELMCCGRATVPAPHMAPTILLLSLMK